MYWVSITSVQCLDLLVQVFSFCWLFLPFSTRKLYPFQTLSLGCILKIFLKFRKFRPRYSYKIYSYKEKECKLELKQMNNFSSDFSTTLPNKTAVHHVARESKGNVLITNKYPYTMVLIAYVKRRSRSIKGTGLSN